MWPNRQLSDFVDMGTDSVRTILRWSVWSRFADLTFNVPLFFLSLQLEHAYIWDDFYPSDILLSQSTDLWSLANKLCVIMYAWMIKKKTFNCLTVKFRDVLGNRRQARPLIFRYPFYHFKSINIPYIVYSVNCTKTT